MKIIRGFQSFTKFLSVLLIVWLSGCSWHAKTVLDHASTVASAIIVVPKLFVARV
ncbi:MAG: hypothetical protein OEM58_07495 [Nitrospirota bacterium]|nr:hypothetical protein [Nitrospirota bacterium]